MAILTLLLRLNASGATGQARCTVTGDRLRTGCLEIQSGLRSTGTWLSSSDDPKGFERSPITSLGDSETNFWSRELGLESSLRFE